MTGPVRLTATFLAITAVVAAPVAIHLHTRGATTATPSAAAPGGPVLSAGDMRSVLLTEAEHPEGTTFHEMPITADDLAADQGGMVVTPKSCLGSLRIALGDAEVDGWMQVGARPSKIGTGQFQSAVARVDGGLDLARLDQAVRTCAAGTVSWPQTDLTAKISLTRVDAPAVAGAKTYAYKSTMTFTDVTEAQLAPIGTCPVEPQLPPVESYDTVSCTTAGDKPASDRKVSFSVDQFVAYAVAGEQYAEACAGSLQETQQMLGVTFDRLRKAGDDALG